MDEFSLFQPELLLERCDGCHITVDVLWPECSNQVACLTVPTRFALFSSRLIAQAVNILPLRVAWSLEFNFPAYRSVAKSAISIQQSKFCRSSIRRGFSTLLERNDTSS